MPEREVLADRYVLGGVLGQGGMGTVYAARDRVLGREVAVKILDVASAPGDALDRFRQEGKFLAGLSHPNVVTIFDFGADQRTAWLVMELLPGPTLDKLLTDQGPLPVGRVVSYGRQCAEALAAAHAAGITHRDVKPANLMLATDGRCVLVDLGIARLAGATTGTQLALTVKGTILGTVAYVAPEIITGQTPGPQADQYALGAVLFSLLTGHTPFAGDTSAAVFGQHVYAAPPRPSSARPDTPVALDDLVVALLAKDPDSRPAATAVASTLATLALVERPDAVALPGASVLLPVSPDATTAVSEAPAAEPEPTRVLSPSTPAAHTSTDRGRPRLRTAALTALALAVTAIVVAAALAITNRPPAPAAGPTSAQPSTQPSTAEPTPTPAAPTPTQAALTPTQVAPTPAPAPAATSTADAVAALTAAIASIADSGAFDASKAQEAQSWVDDFSKELGKSKPGDLRKKIGELDQDLTDYLDKRELSSAGYETLSARLQDLRGTLRVGRG